jgi:hypothetical protein
MIRKTIIHLIAIILLTSCGFKPIYSDKESNFYLSKIETTGETAINNQIVSNLKIYKNKKNKKNRFTINLNSSKTKEVVAKDSKGNASTFKLIIRSKVIIIKNGNIKNEKEFSAEFNYNNSDKKFELKQYEKNIEENLTDKLIEQIILYLYDN